MKKKEKAPILERVIECLEKEQRKEKNLQKVDKIFSLLSLFSWIFFWGRIAFLYFLGEGYNFSEGGFWLDPFFQASVFVTIMLFFVLTLRRRAITKKKWKLIPVIRNLKPYLREGVPPFVTIEFGGEDLLMYSLEAIRLSYISELISEDDMSVFRDKFYREISSLSEEQKEEYLIKLYDLEGFFTYL